MTNDRGYITKEDHVREMDQLRKELQNHYATKADVYKTIIWSTPFVASIATSGAAFVMRLTG